MFKNSENFWGDFFRWAITTIVFGYYVATIFFVLRGDWEFLKEFEYWNTTLTSTTIAIFLRWMWAYKGLTDKLITSTFIKEKEEGKSNLIAEVNSRDLTDELNIYIEDKNNKAKRKAWDKKVDSKIKKYQQRSLNPFRKILLNKWKNEREYTQSKDFNIDVIKVTYYKFNIDDVLTAYYKEQSKTSSKRITLNSKVVSSTRVNAITFIVMGVLAGTQVFMRDFSWEQFFIMLGKFIMFLVNMYSGYKMGQEFVDIDYNKHLTDDYVLLKSFLKEKNIVE